MTYEIKPDEGLNKNEDIYRNGFRILKNER